MSKKQEKIAKLSEKLRENGGFLTLFKLRKKTSYKKRKAFL